jgi:hypothetical protein
MASTINAAVGGIVNTADASGELALQASGTTIATLTASGNVGIGTASPGSKLDVRGVITGGDGTIQTVISYTASAGVTGTISNHPYVFYANNAERARITSTGLGITEGNAPTQALNIYRSGSTQTVMAAGNSNTGLNGTYFGVDTAGNGIINQTQALATIFSTSATERARITSTGNLLVGTTTDLSGVTGAISDSAGNVRAIPQSGAAKTTSYTLVKGDVGEFINVGSGGSIVIPDAVFATGDVVSVFNNTSGNITITCSITTAYIGGTDADKATITLATRGIATILFISGTVCVVNGNVS